VGDELLHLQLLKKIATCSGLHMFQSMII
jgi:hypothetical protein